MFLLGKLFSNSFESYVYTKLTQLFKIVIISHDIYLQNYVISLKTTYTGFLIKYLNDFLLDIFVAICFSRVNKIYLYFLLPMHHKENKVFWNFEIFVNEILIDLEI